MKTLFQGWVVMDYFLRRGLVAVGCVGIAVVGLQAEEKIPWAPNMKIARAMAEEQQRPILIHFWAEWCPPCRDVNKTVFSSDVVGDAVGRSFIPIKMQLDCHRDLSSKYNLSKIPYDVLVTRDGELILKNSTPRTPAEYAKWARETARELGLSR